MSAHDLPAAATGRMPQAKEPPATGQPSGGNPDKRTTRLPDRPQRLYDPSCGKRLDAWGVTRQFTFGQFVILYARELISGQEETVPLVVTPEGTLNRIVRSEDKALVEVRHATTVSATDVVEAAVGSFKDGQPPAGTLAEDLGGLPLDLALAADHPLRLVTQPPPKEVVIRDLRDVLQSKPIPAETGDLRPILDKASKIALLEGHAVDAFAEYRNADETSARTLVRLRPDVREVALDERAVDTALASSVVPLAEVDQALTLDRSAGVDAALRSGSSVTVTAALGDGTLRAYRISASPLPTSAPLAKTFTIADPSPFLRHPYLPAIDGTPLRVPLDGAMVRDLRSKGAITFTLNGTEAKLQVSPGTEAANSPALHLSRGLAGVPIPGEPGFPIPGEPGFPIPGEPGFPIPGEPGFPMPGERGGFPLPQPGLGSLPHPQTPVGNPDPMDGGLVGLTPDPDGGGLMPNLTWPVREPLPMLRLQPEYERWASRARELDQGTQHTTSQRDKIPGPTKGLPVAIFLPWKQDWHFTGLSRGNLLSSIALAPLEERTIRVYSWERRSKALEQSTETETEMQQDYTSTTRDTEDVFREMTSNQKFNVQVGADFEASYTPGVASIKVGAELDLSQEHALQQIARSSTQHLTETVHRASSRVRSRRITKITESEETVRSEDVVRRIVNPNECRTLTLDYYEQIAHYSISTTFDRDRVRVVVMVDNPLRTTPFTNMTLRSNETALRQALLNPELGDGFAAARLLASYENAWLEAKRVAAESKKVAELDRERAKDNSPTPVRTKPENPHKAVVLSAVKDVRDAAKKIQGASIDPALQHIRQRLRPSVTEVNAGQCWLWRTLAAAKGGAGVSDAVSTLAGLAAAPTIEDARRFQDAFGTGTAQELGRLASLPDNEKENLALSGAIRRYMVIEWDWHWWSSSCRDSGLYIPNDAGLVGALNRMSDALGKYDAKESEGDALLEQQQVVQQANEEQGAANWVDKLEMKYGLDVVADAQERQAALLAHLDNHKDYYRYVLFQALPPGEQLKLLTGNAAQLRIGHFEPRVVAYSGDQLAIPLTPTGQNQLTQFLDDLKETIGEAADQAQEAADHMVPEDIILPTAGLVVETSLGECCACEPHRRKMHELEERAAEAAAQQAEAEVNRRLRLLNQEPPNLDQFTSSDDGPHLTVRLETAPSAEGSLEGSEERAHP